MSPCGEAATIHRHCWSKTVQASRWTSEEVAVASSSGGDAISNLLLRVPDVAENLGISRAKGYELMAACEPRSVKIRRCRRVQASDLLAYAEEFGIRTLTPRRGYG